MIVSLSLLSLTHIYSFISLTHHTRMLGVPITPQFGVLTTGPSSGVITVQTKTVSSGVDMPVQEFNFRITPALIAGGIRQPERQFDFPNYMSGQFVSIAVDNL